MKADRRAALKLGLLALTLPGLPAFAASAPAGAARNPGVAQVWGMAFWTADAGEAPMSHIPGQVLHLPEWHPEFV